MICKTGLYYTPAFTAKNAKKRAVHLPVLLPVKKEEEMDRYKLKSAAYSGWDTLRNATTDQELLDAVEDFREITDLPVTRFKRLIGGKELRRNAMCGLFEAYKKLGYDEKGSVKDSGYATLALMTANTILHNVTYLNDNFMYPGDVTEQIYINSKFEPMIIKEREKLREAYDRHYKPDSVPMPLSAGEEISMHHRRNPSPLMPYARNISKDEIDSPTGIDAVAQKGFKFIYHKKLLIAEALFNRLFYLPVINFDDKNISKKEPNIPGYNAFHKVRDGLMEVYDQQAALAGKAGNSDIQQHKMRRKKGIKEISELKLEHIRNRDYEGADDKFKDAESAYAQTYPFYNSAKPAKDMIELAKMNRPKKHYKKRKS